MSAIKPGDLVIVVKPSFCCGNSISLGKVFTVESVFPHGTIRQRCCGVIRNPTIHDVLLNDNYAADSRRLKKIDPPAEGDSLPTRADIRDEVKA